MKTLLIILFASILIHSCKQGQDFDIKGIWEFDKDYEYKQNNKNDGLIFIVERNLPYYKIGEDTIEVIHPYYEDKEWYTRGIKKYKTYEIKGNEIWINDALSKKPKLNYTIYSITANFIYLKDLKHQKLRLKKREDKLEFDEIVFSPINYYSGFAPLYQIKKNGDIHYYNFQYYDNKILDSVAHVNPKTIEFLFKSYRDSDLYRQPNRSFPKYSVSDGGGVELIFVKDNIINKSMQNNNASGNQAIEEAIYYTNNLIDQLDFKKDNKEFKVPLFKIDIIENRKSKNSISLTRTESKFINLLANSSQATANCNCTTDLKSSYNKEHNIEKLSAGSDCIELIMKDKKAYRYQLGNEFFINSYFNGY